MVTYATKVYNTYDKSSLIPYRIVEALFENEDIWKLIYYGSADALSQANLTRQQKANLIWNGQDNQEDYNIFLIQLQENIEYKKAVIMKIYKITTTPKTQYRGTLTYAVEILCNSKMGMLNDYRARLDVLWEEIMRTLSSIEIGGIGTLFFDRMGATECRSQYVVENKTYYGYLTIFGIHYGTLEDR